MATYEDGQAGWELFKESDSALSLAEINDRLVASGYSPVSDRMYLHYRKLVRYGFEYYIPINQLDVKTLQSPVWDRATRGRYLPRPLFVPVRLRLIVSDGVVDFNGIASEVSEGEAVVRLTGQESMDFFEGLGRTKPFAEVSFPSTDQALLGQIERIVLEPEQFLAIVRVGFTEGMVPEAVFPGVSVETVSMRVRLTDHGETVSLTRLVEILYWLVQGLEASRLAAQDLLLQLDPESTIELPPPMVSSIRMESPLEVLVTLAREYGEMFLGLYGGYVLVTKQWWDREVSREMAAKLRWENEKAGVRRRFRASVAVGSLVQGLRKRLGQGEEDAAVDAERAETIIEKQVLPAVQELEALTGGQLELDLEGGGTAALDAFAPKKRSRRRKTE